MPETHPLIETLEIEATMHLLNSIKTNPMIHSIKIATILGVVFFAAGQLDAQLPKQDRNPQQTEPPKLGAPPAPEEVILETKDHVKIVCTYFGAPEPEGDEPGNAEYGKTVIPFILLHDWEGRRQQLHLFGAYLQSQGHAVIVPDFRGHGDSTSVIGSDKPISFKKFRKQEIASATLDIERCKKYMVRRNNEGKLNIDLLCIVAVGKSSVLAAEWTLTDWFKYPSVSNLGIKQGQDVKSLVMVSPRKKLGTMTLVQTLKNPLFSGASGNPLPLMIVWCPSDDETAKDTKSLVAALEKSRPDLSQIADQVERANKKSLFVVPVKKDTASGVKLMNTSRVEGLWDYIAQTIVAKVKSKSENRPWQSREKPKDDE